jgi:hypothetical protein
MYAQWQVIRLRQAGKRNPSSSGSVIVDVAQIAHFAVSATRVIVKPMRHDTEDHEKQCMRREISGGTPVSNACGL